MEKKRTKKLVVVEPAPLSTKKFSVDWSKCCICQDKSKDNLLCPGRNKDSSKTLSGYSSLADNLCAFKQIGELGSIKHFDELDEGLGIATTLSIHEAKWHKSCRLKYNDTKLKRAQKRFEARAQTAESSRLTRSSVPPVEASVEKICFLCTFPEKRNNKLHLVTTLQLNERVKEWAKNVMDARLIGMLQTTDLVASEARYHHKCLQNLRNRCRKNSSSASSETSVCEAIAFAELVAYMQEKMVSENYDFVFPMSTLTKMYKKRLAQLLSIPECELPDVRSTTLRECILDEFPQLLVHRPSKGYQLVCKSTDLSANAHSDNLSQDAIAFARFSTALRKEMFKWKTSFKGTFDQDCQKSSVPPLLLASVNMIVYGTWSPKECKATEPALAIAQLVMFNYKNRAPNGDVVRHNKEQEPPLPLYTALDTYGRTRSRTVIDDLHSRGLSVSSKRVSEVTSSLCHLNINRAEEEKILCPSNLLRGVFTIGAYDNVDHNPSSNTSVGSFHGTSISVFQTPSIDQPGAHRSFQSSYNDSGPQSLDVPHLPESFATVPNVFLAQTKPKIPDRNIPSLSQMLPTESLRYDTESEWLNHVIHSSSHEDGGNWSWAAYHASKQQASTKDLYCAVCSLLPLFFEQSTSISMVRHGMNIIKNITHHLNPLQTPVMYEDQPLYTIGKLIQWNWPDLYGEDKFVIMFAPFHIEKAFLGVIGQYMEGCGWISVAVNAGLATQGSAEAILKVSHVKKSRTAHEITAAALYMLVAQAHTANSPDVSFESWVDEQTTKIPMFRFWLTLLNLEILLLSFVRSLRERNYSLFRECLKQMLPWFFIFDHHNYARWLSVHVADLESLPTSVPDVHAEFCNGNFALRKTKKPFSALAVDQAHEQHNAIVKGDGGAIGLTQDPTALRRWMLAGPELCRLLEDFTNANKTSQELHHEQYPAFQKTFLRQVHAVKASFHEFGNPFQEQTTDLIAIDTRTIVDNDAVCTLTALEQNGKDLYRKFVEERLIKKTSSIFEPIKKVKTKIFATIKKHGNLKQLESVKALKCDISLFSKLLISSQNRHLDLDVFFSYENQTCPPSLSSMGSMRACQKSDIVTVLRKKIENNTPPESCNRNIFDGAALVHSHPPRSSKTFGQYCRKEFRQSIMETTENTEASRVDIVWDLYSSTSLKKQVRDNRGQGVRRQVHEDHKIPGNWSDFLKNAQNKEELFKLIGCYALQEIIGVHIVTNIGPTITSSKPTDTLLGGLSVNSEEADGRIILHAKDMVINGATRIVIHTVDSDVVIIAISYFFALKQLGLHELWISFGTGKHHNYIPAHDLAQDLGEDRAEALRGYHAFTGCDTVSAFYSKGKTLTWKAWQQCLETTSAFRALSNPLKEVTDELMKMIEKYVIMLYCGETEIHSVNEARKILFSKNKSLQNIPPTRDALKMHTLRAAYQAGFVWGQALDPSGVIPSPADWGWTQTEGEWQPLWTIQPSIWKAAHELVKCGCKNSCRGRCSCRREGMPCTLLCKSCYGNCDNTSNLDGYGAYQSRDLILGGLQPETKNQHDLENGTTKDGGDHPHLVKHPTSYMETMLHIFKGNIGSGLLAMGDAFKNGGLVFAPIMTAVLGIISVHSQHLLLNCSEAMQRQTKRDKPPSFANTVGLVFQCGPLRLRRFATAMKLMVDLFLCVTQLGFCCVYIVFISNNIKLICDEYGLELELSVHMIFVVVPILLSCMVRNLKYLTPFSTVANAMMFVGVGAVVYEAAQELPPVQSRAYLGTWTQLPLFFGTAIYAFEGIGLVLPLKREMRKPEQFQRPLGVLNVGMVIVGSIFITVGFLGYLKWGEDVMGSLTLNLQPGTIQGKAAQLLIALAMLFTYPLQMYVPVAITWPPLRKRFTFRSPVVAELAYRFVLVFVTFVLAESIPQLGLFISLVGAISSTALALVFPPLIQLVYNSQQPGGIPVAMAIKDGVIIFLGLFIFVTGTYESISQIVKAFRAPV